MKLSKRRKARSEFSRLICPQLMISVMTYNTAYCGYTCRFLDDRKFTCDLFNTDLPRGVGYIYRCEECKNSELSFR